MYGKLQIFIATHNRPKYIVDCINSALHQNELINVEIIVSDNSNNSETEDLIKKQGLNVRYIKRYPVLSAINHFNTIIKEADGKYLTIFHDDDILLKNYVKKARGELENTKNCAAVGSNAFYLKDNLNIKDTFRKSIYDENVTNQNYLIREYIGVTLNNPPPFPSYMYRVSNLNNLFFNEKEGGKYCDLTFLLKLVSKGKIIWLAEPLISYRLHDGNDTKKEEIKHRLRLARYIYRNTDIKRNSIEDLEMRFLNWLRWLRTKQFNVHKSKRQRAIALKFVLKYIILIAPRNKNNWIKLYNKYIKI